MYIFILISLGGLLLYHIIYNFPYIPISHKNSPLANIQTKPKLLL